jgi:hypothetical protein
MIDLKAKSIASESDLNFAIDFLILDFILAHNFSIGFKSGEYGGRNNILQFALEISLMVSSDL